ncbi:MAG TPA: integrase [Leptolyngbyaceae cyanobacterium M33_DOE_097]|uniref:Integrase n=1 Tax=Oscillatoriales cyanobacterium SpSt-418 TaxID=2282169 RepID=A0A7C3PJ27_9CYAN|nr:integrase [Leptolyngbyaceae cyanobacterium M33_DOE_097]
MDVDEQIARANERLKTSRVGVSIERRGGRLWLRGTFPPKPDSGRNNPYRQKISLGVRATPAGVQQAEKKARLLSAQLNLQEFDWGEWSDTGATKSDGPIIGEVVERFEVDYWNNRSRTPQAETTWKTDYQAAFNKLPKNVLLTLEVLEAAILTTEPDSKQRKRVFEKLVSLAKFAGMEVNFSEKLRGTYSAKEVNPRALPDDKTIQETRDKIQNDAWRWVFGAMAVWGLRPHEVFHLDLEKFPVAQVLDQTKTGMRFVYPLYPEWAEAWNLDDVTLPKFQKVHSNAKLGGKVSGEFNDRKIPFKPYDLRHSYARRCFEFSIPPDWAAHLMGHSLKVHMETYRRWIKWETYKKAYETLIVRSDRPQPPEFIGKQQEFPEVP